MERLGLVWQVEQELERIISLGLLPKGGLLPSEHTLARRYGVSRTTVREAMLRLAGKGLVVQHPGRKSRAVALDEAVTLENLSVALHTDLRTAPERLRLLEGYLSLKRETQTVNRIALNTASSAVVCGSDESRPRSRRRQTSCGSGVARQFERAPLRVIATDSGDRVR